MRGRSGPCRRCRQGLCGVASEVRALSDRSAEAAKDIRSLLDESNLRVEQGVELVNILDSSLSAINEQAISVANVIDTISHAAISQAENLTEVSSAVSQLDQFTQATQQWSNKPPLRLIHSSVRPTNSSGHQQICPHIPIRTCGQVIASGLTSESKFLRNSARHMTLCRGNSATHSPDSQLFRHSSHFCDRALISFKKAS